jgi:anti-sigma regulatory factor (Ser/Thr protein kinase)
VHTLADLEIAPDELLARLNSLVNDFGDASYATCLYAVFDPTTRLLSFASAGHPPPAVVHPDGTVTFPELDPDPPLGVATPPFSTVELVLPDECLLVLYTDGLIESANSDMERGMSRLASTLTEAVSVIAHQSSLSPRRDVERTEDRQDLDELEQLCDTLTKTLLPGGEESGDDAAVLAVRTHSLDPDDVVTLLLPTEPQAAGQARKFAGAQLACWGLDELTSTTELLVSELVGNVVRHAGGPMRLRMLRGKSLVCEVSDGSPTTPRIRHAEETDEGGRGLQLVAALSHRWGTRHTSTGKSIWAEQLRPTAVSAD